MAETLENQDVIVKSFSTEVEGVDESDNINISQNAIDAVTKIIKENNVPEDYFLRFDTKSGGCSGMKFVLGFDNNIDESDRVFDIDGISIGISSRSLFYYMGMTIDYVDGPQGSGFVFNSPNNMPTCGCHA
jgi:iron-sulfur cluster assembly protein